MFCNTCSGKIRLGRFSLNPAGTLSNAEVALKPKILKGFLLTCGFLFLLSHLAVATVIKIDFEGFPDSTTLTNQYAGLTFSSATVITSGISLNEFEFPPLSGSNVIFDDGGPMSISFSNIVVGFGGYFTYGLPLTMEAFDSNDNSVGLAISLFSNNMALSGDTGSSPNEFLQIPYVGGISRIVITGDPTGGSFTLDDATITTSESATVPESSTIRLLFIGILALVTVVKKFSH